MSIFRHAPTRWLGAGALIALGFLLGLLTSGVLGQLWGGPGSTAFAAEGETPTRRPAGGPTSTPSTPNPTATPHASPTATASPPPSPSPVESPVEDEDDDGHLEPLGGTTTPRTPQIPISAGREGSGGEDEGSVSKLDEDTPGGAGAEDIAAAQTVIRGPVYVTIVYQERIDIEIEQDAEGESGDALAASQAIGAVSGGDTSVDARNSSGGPGGSIAESGAALAENSIEVTGPFVQGGIDWSDVAIAGPVSWSVVFEDDVKIKFKQKGEATSGAALADSQSFGIDAGGDVDIDAENGSGGSGGDGSSARSGDAAVDNTIDIHSPLIVGDFLLSGSTLNGDLVQTVSYLDDVKIKFKQTFLSHSGVAAAASQSVGAVAGGDADVSLDNAGTGASRSGDSGGSNAAETDAEGAGEPPTAASTESPEPASPSDGPVRQSAATGGIGAEPTSSVLPGSGLAQAILVLGALAIALVRRRPPTRSSRRGDQTSNAGSP